MQSIHFVCLGNICQSPLAEGIANKYARELRLDIYIDSAVSGFEKVDEMIERSMRDILRR